MRRPAQPPYDYVTRTYGVNPIIGARVRLENTDREGVIARRRSYDNHIWVTFDGTKHASPCHPTSLIYDLGAGTATTTTQPEPPAIGTPLSELSGRPGHPGYDRFCDIASTWGFD
ncbi:hypothetical protein KOAAANKH_00136 [Brevundimonas sp. NIBR10]|uniref:hypothetical protein n=1 Tax=Brevundimonas sp. NIBR10 TaxID=3015997 RepID=UPI0022F1771B|nr:hypothetical protein [Brevundimonas sp. NIBR10]WGM45275.1 hypothetical protein KOAAANKH_00136 [Brevundimonas sp. NIBR10]